MQSPLCQLTASPQHPLDPASRPMRRRESEPVTTETAPGFKSELLALLPKLRAFARSLSGNSDSADDLVQETIIKAWTHKDNFREGTNLRAWLFTILRNTHFSQFRKRRREVEDRDGLLAQKLAVLPNQEANIELQDFQHALDTLPPCQSEALVLVGAAGFSYEEAAAICDCAVGTVKSRVNRARAQLGAVLKMSSTHDFGPGTNIEAVVANSYRSHSADGLSSIRNTS